jgi:hypothetical protein
MCFITIYSLSFAVVIEKRGLLWSVDHSLPPEEKFKELTALVFRRNTELMGNADVKNLKTAAEARITYDMAKKISVYPPELVLAAKEYHGSAGQGVKPADYDLKPGQEPFLYSFAYPENRTVRTDVITTVCIPFVQL